MKRLSDISLARNEADAFSLVDNTMYLPGAVHVFATASKFSNLQQLWSYTSSFPTWLERVRRGAYTDLEREIKIAGYDLPEIPPAVDTQSNCVYLLTAVDYRKQTTQWIVSSHEEAQAIVDSHNNSKDFEWLLAESEVDSGKPVQTNMRLEKFTPMMQLNTKLQHRLSFE